VHQGVHPAGIFAALKSAQRAVFARVPPCLSSSRRSWRADGREVGIDAAFLAAGDYHHHVGLNTWESAGGTPPPPGHTGLYLVAFLYPDRHELGRAVGRLLDNGCPD
jgi:hypothetical protein